MIAGMALAAAASGIFMLNPTNMGAVLGALALRAFGALPITYITMAMLADALDHVEWVAGFRADGFSMSVYTIIFTVTAGLAQGLFNLGLSIFGYVPPPPMVPGSPRARPFRTTSCSVIRGCLPSP